MIGGMACVGVSMLFAIAVAIVLPPVLGHVAATNSFAAAFLVRDCWKILRARFGGFMVCMVPTAGIYMPLMLIGQVLYLTVVPCVLIPVPFAFTFIYLLIIGNVLYAQAYRRRLPGSNPNPRTWQSKVLEYNNRPPSAKERRNLEVSGISANNIEFLRATLWGFPTG
jgi:hypothetical protein